MACGRSDRSAILERVVRVAELLGSLSLATDLSDGFSLEKSLRTTVLATRLARRVTDDPEEVRRAYWAALARHAGCTAFAHEEARYYSAGDDRSLRATLAYVDFDRPSMFVGRALRDIAPRASIGERARALGRLLSPGVPRQHALAQCDGGVAFARAVDLPEVAEVLRLREERWDGRGPRGIAAGEALPLAARVADVADVAELYAWSFGIEEALAELGRRRGGALDPRLVDLFVAEAPAIYAGIHGSSAWDAFLDAEPEPWLVAGEGGGPGLGAILAAFGRIADLTSVHTLGHAQAVAEVARAGAAALGLGDADQTLAELAGLAHDLGRVAISVGIWDKRGALSPYERERVRTHSQQTETILRLAPSLEHIADAAAHVHERGRGDGYHRRVAISSTPAIARLVGAADVYVALGSDRAHRPRFSARAREKELVRMAASGDLDAASVEAILDAPRAARGRRPSNPLGLTDREVEVVRLVAVGRTNPEIGRLLGISPRTAQRHVMNVYDKLGVESRAGLALIAMQHRLLDDDT